MDNQENKEIYRIPGEIDDKFKKLDEKLKEVQESFGKKITMLEQENDNLKQIVNHQAQKIQEFDILLQQKSLDIKSFSLTKENFGSEIANISDFQLICSWLNIPAFQEGDLKLIYSSDKHGMTKQAFMERCCDISPTLIFCKSSQPFVTKFGAYTETKWIKTDSHQYTDAPGAFLFSLTRKQKIEQYRNYEKAQWHTGMQSSWIFGFGMADDFAIKQQKDMTVKQVDETNELSESELGHTFGSGFIHGSENAQTYLAGAHQFRLQAIEVFTFRQIIQSEINNK